MPLSTARPLAAVVVAAVALGWFCSWLNALHYRTHAPFYDSLSYTITLHELMTTAREAGIPAALAAATTADTVFLPHLPAVLLGPFLDPSRSVGVWIQVIELAVLCGSLIAYLMRVERFTGRTAALACGAVLLMARLWRPHGGLSDYRMDFGLMAGYWTVAAWYLISRASLRRVDFLILGLACGAACLMRATAPVYILCGMGPLVIADLARLPGRGRRLGGWLLAAAVATLTGAWFYVLNRDFLYYYYVVWNGDAQAGLGLLESWRHGLFAIRHAGVAALLAALLVRVAVARSTPAPASAAFDWRAAMAARPAILWLAVAPVVMLILRGAGPNPFVSMPASLGLVMGIVVPARPAAAPVTLSPRMVAWLSGTLAVLIAISAADAVARHHSPPSHAMAAHQAILRSIAADARAAGATNVAFGAAAVGPVHAASLLNVALFDMPGRQASSTAPVIDGVVCRPDGMLEVAAAAVWRGIPGDTAATKIDDLCRRAATTIDYLVVPTPPTCRLLAEQFGHDIVNRHAAALRDNLLASGMWHAILPGVEVTDGMVFDVFRNAARLGPGASP